MYENSHFNNWPDISHIVGISGLFSIALAAGKILVKFQMKGRDAKQQEQRGDRTWNDGMRHSILLKRNGQVGLWVVFVRVNISIVNC